LLKGLSWQRFVLGLLVAIPLIAFLFYRTNLKETWDALAEANYAFLPGAFLLFASVIWLQALRWRFLLKPLADIQPQRLYPVISIGHFGNAVLPLRSGEILRAIVLRQREGVSRMATLGTLAVERAIDGLTLAALLLVFVAFVDSSDRLREILLAGGILFGLVTMGLFTLAHWPRAAQRLADQVIDRVPSGWRLNLRQWVASFLTGTEALRRPGGIAAVVMATGLFWVTVAGVYYIIGQAFDIQEGFGTYLLVTAAANLSLSVPSSQGGVGLFELSVRETLVFSGVDTPLATAYALVLHAVLLFTMICVGLVSLWVLGASPGSMSEDAADENENAEDRGAASQPALPPR